MFVMIGAMPRIVIVFVCVTEICPIIEWNARNSGQNHCRSISTTSVLISLKNEN